MPKRTAQELQGKIHERMERLIPKARINNDLEIERLLDHFYQRDRKPEIVCHVCPDPIDRDKQKYAPATVKEAQHIADKAMEFLRGQPYYEQVRKLLGELRSHNNYRQACIFLRVIMVSKPQSSNALARIPPS